MFNALKLPHGSMVDSINDFFSVISTIHVRALLLTKKNYDRVLRGCVVIICTQKYGFCLIIGGVV